MNRYVSPYGLAQIYAALDEREQTFKWLNSAYDDRAVWMSYLAVDPVFERHHTDQRFEDLLRRVRLRDSRRNDVAEPTHTSVGAGSD